ncbi:hypothetical protein MYRNA_42 [Mycobacterium phage Myrna]|uniref:Uncharacterized protein n=1 Tax=Mycobacterium phage Myrna TaxID=546805 RepID=B5LJ53_9CAUD|nr:gp42 [Mycobacterium phage Myrna]ACH62050.1 hypothetical protein MYRNA_42 [Mycobacterium phage Myrna]
MGFQIFGTGHLRERVVNEHKARCICAQYGQDNCPFHQQVIVVGVPGA